MPEAIGVIVTFLFVNMAWVYFRAPDIATANYR
jgi:D-alanyl-lipoteichoic acid acyltransferase DltB (MBOAT superfamily)